MLRGAARPMMLVGGGVHLSGAWAEVAALAQACGMPVAHTMTGKGALPASSPLDAGLFGRYDRIANGLIEEADCLLVVGCKLGEIATKRFTVPAPGKAVIHLDIVAEEMGRTYRPALKLWGDAKAGLADLHAALAGGDAPDREGWVARVPERMERWRGETADRRLSEEAPVHMGRLITELNRLLPEDGILVADGGFAAHWGGLLFEPRRAGRSFVPDRGFASIGYGLPGAMGAQLARPGAVVAGLTGDGGFNMVLGELETARRMKLPVTVIVVNNAASGYVKALQHLMYGEGAYQSSDLVETDYAAVAEAMGCHGVRVERPEELGAALEAAFGERERPSVVDVMVTRDPGRMLPAVDSRAVTVRKGDRVA
jgi:acetolactate synthase-1/2/3 large subunit